MLNRRATLAVATALWGLAGHSTATMADEAASSGTSVNSQPVSLEEVVVTAQRRAQSIQDVSISMDAFTGAQLKQLGMNNVADLAQNTPNVSFTSFFQAGKPQISIRGLSIGALFTNFEQAPVGVYNDDVFMGSRSGQLLQMFDLDRVEVLRGPQGTLFGRNTTAGAINFISKKPSQQFEADADITYGRWNEVDLKGGVTVPISDTLSVRVAGIKRQRDGWIFNTNPDASEKRLDNVDNWGARALLQWSPTSDMTWLVNVHGNGNNTQSPVVHADLGATGQNDPNIFTGYQGPSGWNQVASDTPVYEVLNSRGGYINGSIGLGWSTLTSISAYERVDYREAEDDDGSPYAVGGFQAEDLVSQYSQELRLAGKQGPFDWVAGLYYYTDRLEQETYAIAFTDPIFVGTPLEPFAAISTNSPTQSSHNQAVFADLRYAFNPQWTLDLGARYTHESKHVLGRAELNYPGFDTGFFPTIGGPGLPDSNLNKSWSSPTGRVALEWRPVKDIMAYASWSRGFKSGGFNGLAANSVTELTPYNPETDNTYELGVKTGWLDGRLTANAAVFHNKIKNLQALEVVTENNITYFFVRNAASGTSKGAEFELRAQPGGGWTFSAGVGLLNTRYDSYVIANGPDYSGEEFVNAPKVNGDVMAQYSFPLLGGKLGPEVDYSYVGFRWTDNPHRPGIDGIPGYGLLDASIPWTTGDGRFQVSLWGQNLGNKHYFITTVGNDFLTAGAAGSYHGLPRTYGIRFAYNYR